MAIVMVLTSFPIMALASGASDGPNNGVYTGTNANRPFVSGSPSANYRIPGIVTLDSGTMVAVADARWDQQMDGGGNDVITARSTDGGNNWDYTMAGYYGDNGDAFNKASTGYCDSNITTDGKNLYLLSTFFASGVAINNSSANNQPSNGTGMNEQGKLVLVKSGESSYDYYVGDFGSDGYAPILNKSGEDSGYKVNGEFELYQNGTRQGCVWYSDCLFQAYKTQYLFFRKSTDEGKTWSAPTIVNVKGNDEKFVGAGPGRGIVLSDGTICMPVYVYGAGSYSSGDSSQATSIVYSKDGGQTWSRTANFTSPRTSIFGSTTDWSSEAQLVDLGNGTVRCFYRNGKKKIMYCDATWNGSTFTWGSVVNTGIDIWGNCQISAISYPYLIDGHKAILVASPSDTTGRTTGSIFALLLNSDNTISSYTKKDITASGASYSYSCLTVLPDGRVADLYENGGKDFAFKIFDVSTLTGAEVAAPTTSDIRMNVGQKKSLTFSSKDVTNSNPEVAEVISTKEIPGTTANKAANSSYAGDSVSVERALYKFTKTGTEYTVAHAGMYLSIGTNGKAGYPGASRAANVTIEFLDNGAIRLLQDGSYALDFKESELRYDRYLEKTAGEYKDTQSCWFYLYRRVRDGETSSTELPGYIRTNVIDDGEEYLIVHEYNAYYFILNPSTSTTDMYAHCLKANGGSIIDGYSAVIEAKTEGTTVIKSGLDTYNITVTDGDLAVTGVVSYDPVIYTHGDVGTTGQAYMYCGSTISDGSQAGENETKYTLNDSRYTIESIKCVEDPSANIQFADGKLSGTLHIADTTDYADYSKGETVTIETTLLDNDGNSWIQTDKLYVASNPVAGHTYGAHEVWGNTGNTVNLLPLIFVAEGSYGNTDRKTYAGTHKIYNAYNVEDANALTYYQDKSILDTDQTSCSSSTGDKIAGLCDHQKDGGTAGTQSGILNLKDLDMISAYYYYDMSSDNNLGIKRLNSDGTQFSFELGITPVQVSGSDVYVDASNGVEFPSNDNLNYVSGNGFSTPTAYYNSYNFGDGKQYHTVTGTTSVAANNTATMDGAAELQAMVKSSWKILWSTYTATNWLNLGVTFQVKVCNKSNERTPYNEAVSKVRVSTDYTKETWDKYTTALLNTEAYLNDYTQLTTDDSTATVAQEMESTYDTLTKRADFTELEAAVEENQAAYEKGFESNTTGDQNTYTVDSWENFQDVYEAGKELLDQYPEDTRNNVAGYTVGPDSQEQTTQEKIDSATDDLKKSGLVKAADASAYESARSLSGTIDRTAYPDQGTSINGTITDGNSTIYKEYNGKDYVNVPEYDQDTVDGYTNDLLTEMNVGENSTSGRTFTVTCAVDGAAFATQEQKTQYNYGTVAHIDLSAYKDSDTVCVVKAGTGIDVTETKIDLSKCNYQLALLVQQDITVTVTTATAPNVIVADYFGTVLGAFVNASSVTVNGNTVTVGDTVITAKDSPKYTFTGWTWGDGTYTVAEGQVMQIVQRGTRTDGAATFTIGEGSTAENAKINGETTFEATGLNTPLELTSDNAEFWTRTVDGVETLASYEQDLTLFSSNVDTQFKAYASANELPQSLLEQAESGTPVAYGVGYFADNKFTLSCDFSAGSDVTVLEVGALYSTTKSGKDELVKGGDGTLTVVSRNVAHWTNNQNSGTFTMTKKGSDTGTHYMRAYVSYRVERQGTQVPFVVYGDVYQCVNGTVTAVNN